MRKRVISLLFLFVVVLANAPAALADHCRICRLQQGVPVCWPAVTGGKPFCDDFTTPGTCVLSGTTCTGPHPFIEEPLAADYTVASVERLDEPSNPAPTETRIASLETVPSANR